MEITFESVSKQYKKKHALKNFTAALSEGVYGLLGENGAGKTTLINTFVGILRGDSGTIRVDGQDVRTLGKAFLSQIGYMPQYPIFSGNQVPKPYPLAGVKTGGRLVQNQNLRVGQRKPRSSIPLWASCAGTAARSGWMAGM